MYTKEQQAENRKKWVAALRSGQYPQTKGCLQDDVGFCCLGVACDLYLRDLGRDWEFYRSDLERNESDHNVELCSVVMDYFGIRNSIGQFGDVSLAELNDGYDSVPSKTFAEIADIIESEPKGLLV